LRDAGSATIKVAYPGREKQMKIRQAMIGEAAGTEKQCSFLGSRAAQTC
jgi:hypothetical protein